MTIDEWIQSEIRFSGEAPKEFKWNKWLTEAKSTPGKYEAVRDFAKAAGIKGFGKLRKNQAYDIIQSYERINKRLEWIKDQTPEERYNYLKSYDELAHNPSIKTSLFRNVDSLKEGNSTIINVLLRNHKEEWEILDKAGKLESVLNKLAFPVTSDLIQYYDPSSKMYKNSMAKYQQDVEYNFQLAAQAELNGEKWSPVISVYENKYDYNFKEVSKLAEQLDVEDVVDTLPEIAKYLL